MAADQLADRQGREEVLARGSGSARPVRVAGDERGDGRAVVLDPDDPAVVVDRAAAAPDLVAGRLPHLAGAEPGVLEAVDQGLDDLALALAPARRRGRSSTAWIRLSPLIRCAAQSAVISLVGIPQTFSV